MANHSSAAFAILLLVAAAMATPQTASSFPLDVSSVLKCWEALSHFDGCFPKVLVPEALNIQLKLTRECCRTLEEIRENCFPSIYTNPSFSFAPKLGSVFLQICGDHSSAPAPQPATIAQ